MKNKNNNKRSKITGSNDKTILCDGLGFAGEEAYKMLRTNLTFSFTEPNKCRVIGITSAARGEGKSTTSINLAYTISKTDQKVLLLDADMRLPTVAKRLGLRGSVGLSDLLVGKAKFNDVLQYVKDDERFCVIAAGSIPPNPSELLASDQISNVIQALEEVFDYIIIDLPPVNIVSDALLLSKLINGYLFIVKQEQSTRQDISEAMRKFSIVDAKILGFVMTNVETGKKYYKYRKKYGYGYGYGYGYEGYGHRSHNDHSGEDVANDKHI